MSSVTGGPVPAYISVGGSKAVTGPGSGQGRLQPAAAPLCGLSRTASFSKPFYQIKAQYSTSFFLCQGGNFWETAGVFPGPGPPVGKMSLSVPGIRQIPEFLPEGKQLSVKHTVYGMENRAPGRKCWSMGFSPITYHMAPTTAPI